MVLFLRTQLHDESKSWTETISIAVTIKLRTQKPTLSCYFSFFISYTWGCLMGNINLMLCRPLTIDVWSEEKQCYFCFVTNLCIWLHISTRPINDECRPWWWVGFVFFYGVLHRYQLCKLFCVTCIIFDQDILIT